ncbi:hypothetical protein ADILRU_1424 [Leifsonia rubra CMS 76R]|nr:hypothetical protein ADILRU_1424 [Leifsonia rubra CMS 76R]
MLPAVAARPFTTAEQVETLRTASAKEYTAATRMYGLVDAHLLWAWDITALGQDLRNHASGRLARVE